MAGAVIVDVSAAVENTIARNLQLVASHGKGVDAVVTNNQAELLVHPKAPICMRIETTKFRTFAKGYLQKSSFRKYCAEQGINATSVVSQLQTAGIISKSAATRALGKGTEYETGSVPVYVVNLQHKDLASSELVDTTENRPAELGNLLEQRAYG